MKKGKQPCRISLDVCYINSMSHIDSPPSHGFKPGQSGNLAGRPKTIDVRRRNAATASLAVWERLVEQSLDGNLDAAALVLEHLRGNVSPGPQRGAQAGKTADGAMVAPHDP